MSKNASVVLRFSNRSTMRARNLTVLLQYLKRHPSLEIIVSVMDLDFNTPAWVKKIYTPDQFESSRANNLGAAVSTTNIFIFQDADIIFDLDYYNRMIENLKTYESVRIGENCVNIGAALMHKLQDNPEMVIKSKCTTCLRDAPGACIGLTRHAFIRIGGYCELFKVYGWEDVYFRYKVKKLTKQTCLNKQMIHMPHETNYQMGQQPVNAPLYHELLQTDGGDCVRLAKRDMDALINAHPSLRIA